MVWLAGVDGCEGGWFRACRDTVTGELRFDVIVQVGSLLRIAPCPDLVTIDIPIGLTDSGQRACDIRARELLGHPRGTSVFPAPVRPALGASNREEASRITQAADGRRVSAQAFALYQKIREVDQFLRTAAWARSRLREVHPELCFWAWAKAGGQAIRAGKKTHAGHQERRRLVDAWLDARVFSDVRKMFPMSRVADDDILDSIAALWTAARITSGEAHTVPAHPPRDSQDLPMEMVY